MTPEEAHAIIQPIKDEVLALYERSLTIEKPTDRDWAQLVELQARFVDYLDLLETDPIPVEPFLSLDQVANFVEKHIERSPNGEF